MQTAVIIDDSPLVRGQLRQILVRIGVNVVAEGATGDLLLPLYRQHQPDLVTLDIVMPGKDGVTAVVELLQEFPSACVVMCTSLSSRDKILACQRAGVAHYILKPFDPARAEQVLRFVLRRPAMAVAAP
jgi:two-component system chemotaxis response regulator CheY